MSRRIFLTSAALACLACSSLNASLSHESSYSCGKSASPYRITARHTEANGIGYNLGYTTLEGFFSFLYPRNDVWVPILDLRGHVFNNGKLAANAGIGLRYLSGSRVWGANAFYDYRNTTHQHYNQVSLGLESLGEIWDFRINGYLPVGNKVSSLYSSSFGGFHGNYLYLKRKREFAFKGMNAEVGAHVDQIRNIPFYFAAGPYYLQGQGKTAWGGALRVAVEFYRYLTLEGNTSYDHLFKWIGQGQISLNFPFGGRREVNQGKSGSCSKAMALNARALQRVDRMEIIPVDKKRVRTLAINPATGQPYVFWFVNNTSSSAGTYESPFPTLLLAQNASNPGDVIYVMPGDLTATGMSSGIALKDNQKLWGSSLAHSLTTTAGAVTVPSLSSSTQFADSFPMINLALSPVITNTLGADVITAANNNEISGFFIQNLTGSGINASSLTNLSVTNCIFQGSSSDSGTRYGINLSNAKGSILIDSNMFNQGITGINIVATGIQDTNYTVSNNDASVFTDAPSTTQGNFLIASYVDCANIATLVSGNDFNVDQSVLSMTFDNTTSGARTCPVVIANNSMNYGTGSANGSLLFTLNHFANVDLQVANNLMFSGDTNGVYITQSGNSQLALAMTDNTVYTWTNPLNINMTDSAQLTGFVSGNNLQSDTGTGIDITANVTASIPAFTIQNNQFGSSSGVAAMYFTISDSSTTTFDILSNTLKASEFGVVLVAGETSTMTANVNSNTITVTENYGLQLGTTGSSVGNWNVNGNQIIASGIFYNAPLGAALVTNSGTSTTNLNFSNNMAAPIYPLATSSMGTYQFTNNSGTFKLISYEGNTGALTKTGTITSP